MNEKLNNATILFAGGGTGGHLYPGISVALALKKTYPNCKPLFLCTTRDIDKTILDPTGFEYIPQPIVPPVKSISGLLRFWKSWGETRELLKRTLKTVRPAAVLGLGGYGAGVAVKDLAKKGIPAAIINPDVIPGKANNYLLKYASAACCQFQETAAHVSSSKRKKLQYTGCPIRPEIQNLPTRANAAAALGLKPELLTLVITGASLGAQTVNEAVLAALPNLTLQGWQILHLTGATHAAAVSQAYRNINVAAHVVAFTPAMEQVWAVADLAICRCGASTCAELTACGIPSILMPYPYHKDMHQRANAQVLVDAGAALLVDDQKDAKKNAAVLQPLLSQLLYNASGRQAMAAAARQIGRPDAAERVVKVLESII